MEGVVHGIPGHVRIRAVTIGPNGAEITSDLPHLGLATVRSDALQPGTPSNSTLGDFVVPLHPPGTRGYAAAKSIYDQLDYFTRLEFYKSVDGRSIGGQPFFAGPILRKPIHYSSQGASSFQLEGMSDLFWLNYSAPFPGEFLSNDVTSTLIKSYMGTNELGWSDNFSPFNAANYTSTATAGGTAGSWTATTDDGLNVVSVGSGTGAALIALNGAAAGDRWHTHYVEVQCRMAPSGDTSNSGIVGVGLSSLGTTPSNGVLGYVSTYSTGSSHGLSAHINVYSGGGLLSSAVFPNVLSQVTDPVGYANLTIGLLLTTGGNANGTATATLIVNGKVVVSQYATGYDPGTSTRFPWIQFGTPATGSATAWFSNFVQAVRFTNDGPSGASMFVPGTVTTSTNQVGYNVDPGPSFLDAMMRFATRDGYFMRYTPQRYIPGVRTLGSLDYTPTPGTDRSRGPCIYRRRDGTLTDLMLDRSSDDFMPGTGTMGQPTQDGGGVALWRDISTIVKYGMLEDQTAAVTASDYGSLKYWARRVVANRIAINTAGAKQATVVRTAETADVARELDQVLIDDPELNVNDFTSRILSVAFTEGSETDDLYLDQFMPV